MTCWKFFALSLINYLKWIFRNALCGMRLNISYHCKRDLGERDEEKKLSSKHLFIWLNAEAIFETIQPNTLLIKRFHATLFLAKVFTHRRDACVRDMQLVSVLSYGIDRCSHQIHSSTEEIKSGNVNAFLQNLEMLKIETHYVQRDKCYHILIKLSIYQSENAFKRCP